MRRALRLVRMQANSRNVLGRTPSRLLSAAAASLSVQVATALADMCVELHMSVEDACSRFHAKLRRRYYTTPKSYLDMLDLYLSLLAAKRWVCQGVGGAGKS